MTTPAANDVSTPCKDYLTMAEEWRMIAALMGGTKAMRLAGQEYLPQYAGEDATAYAFRLKWTYLYNFYKKAVKTLVGKPFARALTKPENLPAEFEAIDKDFDMQGNDITIAMKKWFECALANGLSYGLVDYPDTGGQVYSVAEEKDLNLRPYFVHIPAKDVIGWKTISVNGVKKLQQVRIRQVITEPDGLYGEKQVEQVRVFTWDPMAEEGLRVTWETHRKTDDGNWVMTANGFMSAVNEIPLVALYTGQTGFMTAEPPLLDLAYINVAHYQSGSDLRHIAHILSVPILFGTGWAKDQAPRLMQVGPDRMITTPNPEATLEYVEHGGKAVDLLQKYMEKLEAEMTAMAIKLLAEKASGGITATEISVDTASAESALKSMCISLQDAMEHVLYFMQEWLEIPSEKQPEYKVNKDFGLLVGNDFIANWLLKANAQGIVQKKTVLEGAKTLGYVAEDLDVDAEIEAADEESVKAFENMEAALGDHAPAGGRTPSDPKDKQNPLGKIGQGGGDVSGGIE